jgi:hypothetical protein
VLVELTERGKSLEDWASCPGSAAFGDIGIPVERIFCLTDEVKALHDASMPNWLGGEDDGLRP